jgi:LuxR family maltose regulon positive regulatory protein
MPRMLPTTRRSDRHRAPTTIDLVRPGASVPKRPSPTPDPDVTSAASSGTAPEPSARPTPPSRGAGNGHGLVAVGPGLAGSMLLGAGFPMNPLPVQPAKIHRPPRRDDTLSRERLNSWLDTAAAGRLGLIVAEAGFGKTTLLADWAGLTRRHTAWYRLEPDDRDWLTFIRHLVAGGRELDPEFAPDTFRMLLSLGPGGPTPKDLAVSIAREMAEFGIASSRGLTLILDDYHVVDGCTETEPIVRALVDRTAPGFSVIIATRSKPTMPMGRIRARGGVMTIAGSDLCFDVQETSRLFRDAYHHPLDEDLVSDLHDRTDGWAALLTLVRTSLEEQDDPRALVEHLDASRGDLHDFLAEEVLATLPAELQHFLTRVAVLMAVDVETAMLVDEQSAEAVAASIRESDRLGLLSRPDRESPHRFHPLVRDFLVARLTAEIGEEAVRELHRSLGARLVARDWHAAAWHFMMARDASRCAQVVDSAVDEVIAAGRFEQVRPFLAAEGGDPDRPIALVLRSKIELGHGNYDRAAHWAQVAVASAAGTADAGLTLLNLASILGAGGPVKEAVTAARSALAGDLSETQRYVAQASLALWEASEEGDLLEIADGLRRLARQQEHDGRSRYAGISRLNLAGILLWLGETSEAVREAGSAETALGGRASNSLERVSATSIKAVALAQSGRLQQAIDAITNATDSPFFITRDELAVEAARISVEFGAAEDADASLRQCDPDRLSGGHRGYFCLMAGQLALRVGDYAAAESQLERLDTLRCADAAGKLRTQSLRARVSIFQDRQDARQQALEALRIATAQKTRPGRYVAGLLVRLASRESIDDWVAQGEVADAYCWSLLAEEIAANLDQLGPASLARVRTEAELRPLRWRSALRQTIARGARASGPAAALLAAIGSGEDAAHLRTIAATRKSLRPSALAITQRLAQSVFVSDLGVIEIRIGSTVVPRGVRRKVLALLCFLSSRPGMAVNRDEALDAIWPDLNPEAGGNSLHQAIYYLRRVVEPEFREGMSAGYVQVDGDIVSLHPTLVDTASRECWRLLRQDRGGDEAALDRLLRLYRGRYALDFVYEDWAATYRENLHAAVLAHVEVAQARARDAKDFERAIRLGHTALAIDPQADAIELELLKAYKASGRQAAAAEQYAHYATLVRTELAVEPPSFDDI